MKLKVWMLLLGWAIVAATPLALAVEVAKVAWQTDVAGAWQTTQRQGRPMLVFVTRDDCHYCTQMKQRTYASAAVAGAINAAYVPLVLDGGSGSPLLKELNVTAYPSTFIISPQAVVMERIEGYVAAEILVSRLHALLAKAPIAQLVKDP